MKNKICVNWILFNAIMISFSFFSCEKRPGIIPITETTIVIKKKYTELVSAFKKETPILLIHNNKQRKSILIFETDEKTQLMEDTKQIINFIEGQFYNKESNDSVIISKEKSFDCDGIKNGCDSYYGRLVYELDEWEVRFISKQNKVIGISIYKMNEDKTYSLYSRIG